MQSSKLAASAKVGLDALLQSAVNRRDVPSVIGIVANQESVLYRGAVNTATTDIFRIASMTKPVTSVSIMMLKERGLLDLDDPVENYLPEYTGREVICDFSEANASFATRPATNRITIRHLLTHTAGFGYAFCNTTLNVLYQATKQSSLTLPLLYDPGSCWTYGSSTKILGDVVTQITHEPFYTFQETQILQPLGMFDTGYTLKPKDQARLAPLHYRADDDWVRDAQPEPFEPHFSADGGLIGTADDYIRFLQMLLNMGKLGDVQILTEQSVREMISNQIGDLTVEVQPGAQPETSCSFPLGARVDKFGLGFQLKADATGNGRSLGSYSWGGLFNTHFWADPQRNIAAVLFTQMLPFYDDRCVRLLCDFEDYVYKNLL